MSEEQEYRRAPLYAVIVCGLLIFLIGLGFFVTKNLLYGRTLPGGRGSSTPWQPVVIDGIGLMLVGLIIGGYPAYLLLKKARKKKL